MHRASGQGEVVTVHMILIFRSKLTSAILAVTVVDFGEDACCSQTSLVGDVGFMAGLP